MKAGDEIPILTMDKGSISQILALSAFVGRLVKRQVAGPKPWVSVSAKFWDEGLRTYIINKLPGAADVAVGTTLRTAALG